MSECVMLIALAKTPAGKKCFSSPYIRLLSHPTTTHPLAIKAPPKNKN